MLQTLILLLTVFSVITLLLQLAQMKKLRSLVRVLPPLIKSDRGLKHHLVGANLHDFFQFPTELRNIPVIVAFASPTCMSCFKHMKDYLDEYGTQHAFLCILRSEGDEIDARFLALYGSRVPIIKTTPEFMKNVLREPKTPLWLVIDQHGIVVEVEIDQKKLHRTYQELLQPTRKRKGVGV